MFHLKEYLHYTRASFREAAFRKLNAATKEKFSCVSCKFNNGKPDISKVKTGNSVNTDVTLESLFASVKFMSNQFDDFGKQLREILNTVKELKEENKQLRENNRKLQLDCDLLSLRINSLEQKSISNYIEIIGVTECKTENCVQIVEEIASKLDQQVSVVKAYRIRTKIPNKPTKIVAELMSAEQKKNLMDLAKKKKINANSIN